MASNKPKIVKEHIRLSDSDRKILEAMLSDRSLTVKIHKRVQSLLLLHAGCTFLAIGQQAGLSFPTLQTLAERYRSGGLSCLQDLPKYGRPPDISGEERAKITALACSEAPAGHAHWTLRLLSGKVVELGICEHLSYVHAGTILKKRVAASLKRQWCIATLDAAFLAKMERILWLYALPYDEHYPVVCYDERPCFLIDDSVAAIAIQSDKPAKENYAFEKNGSCCLLAAIEPLTGKRLAQVHKQRTKKEYTLFMQALAALYPNAIKIKLVQDNLNTHTTSAFYEHLSADAAFALVERFAFYYTPKSSSWLWHD